MKRKNAIPMIEKAVATETWRNYLNLKIWGHSVNFTDKLLELFENEIPEFINQMGALTSVTKFAVLESPIELIHVPDNPGALMGQIEWLLPQLKAALFIIFYKGQFWVREKEFFPFD